MREDRAMAIVQMKCPNCGGNMLFHNNQFECPYCYTILLNIVDATIDGDVTIMDVDEFSQKLEASKRQFVVNINDRLMVGDVDTMVINKKLKDAKLFLDSGQFDKVPTALKDIPYTTLNSILAAQRLLFLSELKVHSEAELMFYDGLIDRSGYYQRILQLADEPTKQTYLKLAELCTLRENIKKEVARVEELWKVDLKQESVAYAKSMCQRYPQSTISWTTLFDIKSRIDPNYVGDMEYERMISCPDYKGELPKIMQQRFDSCRSCAFTGVNESLRWMIFSALCCIVLTALVIFFIGMVVSLWTYADHLMESALLSILIQVGIPLLALAALIAMIIFFVHAQKTYLNPLTRKRVFRRILPFVPKTARAEAVRHFNAIRRGELLPTIGRSAAFLIMIGCIVGACFFVPYILHPTVDGITYSSAGQLKGGYEIAEIHTADSTLIVPETVLFSNVTDIAWDVAIDSDVSIKEIVLPYEVGKWTTTLSRFHSLERIFLYAPYPSEDDEEYRFWSDVLEDNYSSSATIYWEGEWEMTDGKPVVLENA